MLNEIPDNIITQLCTLPAKSFIKIIENYLNLKLYLGCCHKERFS